ncbi:MAG: MFS transporter [Anaerolineae bacterium]
MLTKKKQIRKSLFLLWISHFFIDFFTGIWPIYKTVAKIDIAKAGLILGVAGFIGEILQPVFGYLSDQGHRKNMLIIGLALCAPMLCISYSDHLLSSFFILLSMMIGSAAFHPAAVGMVPTLVTENKARNLLFFNSGGAVGFGLSQIIFLFFFFRFDRDLFMLLLFPGAWILVLFLHQFPTQAPPSTSSLKGFLQPFLFYRKSLSLLYFSQVVYQGMRATFLFFLPEVLQARCSNQWVSHGGGFFFFVLGTAVAMMPAGHLSDKYGLKRVLLIVVSHTICLFCFLLLSKQLAIGECLFLLTLLGALFGVINPLTISWGHSLVPQSPSTVSGLLMGLAWCVGNLTPACAGFLHAHFAGGNDRMVLSIMATFLIIVFFLLLSAPRPVMEADVDKLT